MGGDYGCQLDGLAKASVSLGAWIVDNDVHSGEKLCRLVMQLVCRDALLEVMFVLVPA